MRILLRVVTTSVVAAACAATVGACAPSPQPTADVHAPTGGPASARASTPPSAAVPSLIPGGTPATVIRVVDGDTIHARISGVDESVRIIGLDSPETSKPGTPVECFARQATAAAQRLMAPDDPITLQSDPTQDERDGFDRLLAHVVLADGSLFAERMIEGGWAVHYVYDGVPSMYAQRLQAAEDRAKAAQLGLWSPSTCGGDPHLGSAPP